MTEPFYAHFHLSRTQILPVLENVLDAPLTRIAVASPAAKAQNDTQLVTFLCIRSQGEAEHVTLFVKRCTWKGRSESVHYRYLATAGVPTPRLYGAVTNAQGEEVIFLEPATAIGFDEHTETGWRGMLSLLARFNACPITPAYRQHLHPFEQVGQIDGGFWITGLRASPNDAEMEESLRACGIGIPERLALKRAAHALFTQVQAQPQGLLHQDFLPDNFGWRGVREEKIVFDLHKNSLGPRFADVAPYLSSPDWSQRSVFLDDRADRTRSHREALTQHYLEEYARFGGERVSPETFRAETMALFWAHKVTVLPWLIEQKQQARIEQVLHFLGAARE